MSRDAARPQQQGEERGKMIGGVQVLLWAMVRGARKPDKVKFDYWKTVETPNTWLKGSPHHRANVGSTSIFNYIYDHNADVDLMDNIYFFRKSRKMLDEKVADRMINRLGIGVER